MTPIKSAALQMNEMGKKGIPFLFVFDFLMNHPIVCPVDEIDPENMQFFVRKTTGNPDYSQTIPKNPTFEVELPSRIAFGEAFDKVMHHLRRGDSYLLNLTMPVNISTNLSLKEIFLLSKAPYKLWIKDRFTVFSPEPFVSIRDGRIFSYPMKGTMDATIPDAVTKLLANEKELAEHYTIVDLIRNDLSMVSEQVRVEKFRYVEEITTIKGKLLQTSSLISGRLPANYINHIGDIMVKLLPAGSISGAPKKRTTEIILEAEQYERGYYTGVFGLFDGKGIESAVMIRFIEQTASGLVFKAGGGITVNSQMQDEYDELVNKVYLPLEVKP
jgi:para-aminobenzoate synthetase component I